jgi:signal transduction histidine kinase
VLQAERLTLVGKFARTIVHDFKNPLNIIGISADMAAMDNATLEMRQTCRDSHPPPGGPDEQHDQ